MKKLRILLLLLVPTLLSTSCSEGVLSSRLSKPSDSSSPSKPSTPLTPETTPQSSSQDSTSHVSKPDIKGDDFTAQDIYEQLNFAAVANNYTINYDYKSVSYEDVFTQDYFYYGISNTGYMLLESYENSKERLAYSFSLINHEVKNLSAMATIGLDGSLVKINDLTKVDPLTYIEDDPSLASEIIPSSTKNMFYSTSVNLKNALSNALNISSSEVNSVNLVMDKDLNIGFSLINSSGKIIDDGIGVIRKADESSYEDIASFQKDFVLPKDIISEASIKSLTSKKLSSSTSIVLEDDGKVLDSSRQKVQVQYDADSKLQLKVYNNDGSLKTTKTYLKENDENLPKAVFEGVNGLNEVDTKLSDSNWNDLQFALKYATPNAFRKEKDGSYHYYGYQLSGLAFSLTYLPLSPSFASLDVKVENNVVDKAIMSTNYGLREDGSKVRYLLESDISNEINFTPTESFQADSNTPKVEEILKKLSAKDSTYKATIIEKEEKYQQTEVLTVTPETIFKDYSRNDDGQTSTYGKGYTLKDGGVMEFEQNKDGSLVSRSDPDKADSIFNHLPWKAKSEVFDLDSNNSLVLKDGVINIFDSIIVGDEGVGMDESSLKFTVNNGKLTKIEFSYSSAIGTTGNCTVSIEYDNVAFSDDFKAKLEGLTYDVPSSWIDEGTHVYDEFRNLLTDEEIKSLPYVYDKDLSMHWSATYYYAVMLYNTKASSTNLYEDYMTRLKKDAVKKGYALDPNDKSYASSNMEAYVNKTLGIKVYIGKYATAASGLLIEKM